MVHYRSSNLKSSYLSKKRLRYRIAVDKGFDVVVKKNKKELLTTMDSAITLINNESKGILKVGTTRNIDTQKDDYSMFLPHLQELVYY